MSIAGSIAGESVYYEEPYSVPGPCRTCCMRCPCPSILASLAFLGGAALFCLAGVLAGQQAAELFQGTYIGDDVDTWISYISIALYVEVAVMTIFAVALLGISCLGTGAVRKEFMWRFRSRARGRCQTALFMIVVYFLFLLWLSLSFVSLVPIIFFYIQRRGMCLAPPLDESDPSAEEPCIDLKQWSLVPADYKCTITDCRDTICGAKLTALCDSNVLLWFSLAFFAAVLVTLSMLHFLINFSANFAKLRDRFKDGFANRKSGAYLVRAGSVRSSRHSMRAKSSLRASRNNVLRGSRGSLRTVSNHDSNNYELNDATNNAETLRMTEAYRNQTLNGSRDELYATTNMNHDSLGYDREPVSALQNHYVDQPQQPPPAYGSRHGIDQPVPSIAGAETGPPPAYGRPNANGRAPSHASSSISGNASGNFPAHSKMNTLDYNRDIDYKRDDFYPRNSNFNLKPTNYHDSDVLDGMDAGSVHGSVQHSSAGDNSDGVFGSSRWGYNQYHADERSRRPLSSYADPEPAPSLGSPLSDRAPLGGFSEHYI
ncbi:uncharacterized protein LOC110985916 [Acanthaster planci]|uniref:Uncharacterized protein LOC110985916 n=1 Tax=Acanthaster planci TaxID=133434 RepID=A0A8B7ZIH8_ACAPL|nr:uncharacterized protein LOC110985916 [Acanthaster planci]